MKRKRIVLHGALAKEFTGVAEFAVETVAEAIKAFLVTTGSLRPIPGRPRWSVRAVGFDTVESLFEPTDVEEIHLVPSFCGGKKGGFIQIALGVVLIALSFVPFFAPLAPFLLSAGISMLLGGLASMLSPSPKRDTGNNSTQASNPEASKYLGAPGNTTTYGTRIPIPYGRNKLFGHYISFDIDATDVAL